VFAASLRTGSWYRKLIAAAVEIATESGFSLPGTLKNAIDWVSRLKPMPLRGKTGLLLSASNSQVGGIRGLWQLRTWVEQQFDDRGRLKEPERQERLVKSVGAYLEMARKLAG
jgi:chromate reductase, NAD(P)H dehydrogenase (quinone)